MYLLSLFSLSLKHTKACLSVMPLIACVSNKKLQDLFIIIGLILFFFSRNCPLCQTQSQLHEEPFGIHLFPIKFEAKSFHDTFSKYWSMLGNFNTFADSLPETHLGAKVADRHDSSYIGNSGRSAIKHSSKFEHAAGGGSAGAGESGHNGGSSSPAQGGRNFIPVYVAGAANNRQNHHRGSGNCNQYSIGISTLVAVTVGSLIAHFYLLK